MYYCTYKLLLMNTQSLHSTRGNPKSLSLCLSSFIFLQQPRSNRRLINKLPTFEVTLESLDNCIRVYIGIEAEGKSVLGGDCSTFVGVSFIQASFRFQHCKKVSPPLIYNPYITQLLGFIHRHPTASNPFYSNISLTSH